MSISDVLKIDYLRISVTDRCNLRCIYCQPLDKSEFIPRQEILGYEEMGKLVQIFNELGIKYVRITGGEPLVRRGVEDLIGILKAKCSFEEVSMTTNGVLLQEKLPDLVKAGLDRINLSLNTLKRERYCHLTGRDKFEEVKSALDGILSATSLPLKINVVLLKGINDDEIRDFAALTEEKRVNVRFIEYFPIPLQGNYLEFVPNALVKEVIETKLGKLLPAEVEGRGPAVNYKVSGAEGEIGFISSRSNSFCGQCNRLRLTAQGDLHACLFSPPQLNLKEILREGRKKREIRQEIAEVMKNKRNYSKSKTRDHNFCMSDMGG